MGPQRPVDSAPMPGLNNQKWDGTGEWFSPLRVGMPVAELRGHFSNYIPTLIQTNASQMLPGGFVVLDSGIEVGFTLGNDKRVRSILTEDSRVRVGDRFAVGTTYGEALSKESQSYEILVDYFARYVRVEPGVWLVFRPTDPPDLAGRVLRLEIRATEDNPPSNY